MAIESYELEFEFIGLDSCFGSLERIKAPLTIERISRKIPFKASGRFYIGGRDYFMIPLGIKKGLEHPTDTVEKGDIFYEANSDSLFICLKAGSVGMAVTKLGKIVENLEVLNKISKYSPVNIKLR
ncbi:MAG: hypothetical protein JW776_15080 [Candidatus Lokiarchaeota archaeon]|nr:hypothetical protein [Candidatus Lokiarchaeota archaeon]